jgi:hypothetical protein
MFGIGGRKLEGRLMTLTAGQMKGTAINIADAAASHRTMLLEKSNVRDVRRGHTEFVRSTSFGVCCHSNRAPVNSGTAGMR